jgi:AGZA family xanthine/uracil permease-like MFS transporter
MLLAVWQRPNEGQDMKRYGWARPGDINAFFGLMLDNVTVMVLLFGLLSSAVPVEQQANDGQIFFTPGFVLTHMIPGTALGVLVGDLIYTLLAFQLARRSGRDDVTAMPLGLDTPSTIGIALLILRPALNEGYFHVSGRDHAQAMTFAWHVGVVVLVLAGIFKIVCAPLGNALRRLVPRAGLLGSLAAIALALIAFLSLAQDGVAAVPLVGLAALAVILWTLIAHRELPGRFPGALAAVLLGVLVYQVCRWMGPIRGLDLVPPPEHGEGTIAWEPAALVSFYRGQSFAWWQQVFVYALGKLPVALPFVLATIVGGIDCTESAAAAGDEFDTRSVLLTEGVASLVAGLLGGVIQTTPYIGHPAYKKMGGRAAYTLATALFIGGAGYFGGFHLLFEWLPRPAMFPILVFVGLEITAQSFHATPARHYPALALAMLPALAYLITIPLGMALGLRDPDPQARLLVQTLRCLAGGFIITSLLWAAALAMLIDGRLLRAALFFALAGVFALFGIIHSPLRSEQIDLPQRVLSQIPETFQEAIRYQTPYHWAGAYGLVAILFVVLHVLTPPAPLERSPASDRLELKPLSPGSPGERGWGEGE